MQAEEEAARKKQEDEEKKRKVFLSLLTFLFKAIYIFALKTYTIFW